MTSQTRTARSSSHSAEMREVYERMLRTAGARGRFVAVEGGRRVHVIEAGDGVPVVHLHGNNTSALSHLMLLEHTTAVRSYLVDRPGMGLSETSDFPRGTFRDFTVRFVNDVLDALELDDAVFVGASGGGVYATYFAIDRPDRVRGLAMLGSTPALPGGHVPLPIRLMATPVLGHVMARAMRPGRRMMLAMMASMGETNTITRHPDLLDSLIAGANDPAAVAANRAELRALVSPFGFRSAARIRPDELRHLTVPTLMIWGDHDPVVPLEAARASARLIPHAHLEILSAGHVPQLGHPEQVGRLLTTFAHGVGHA